MKNKQFILILIIIFLIIYTIISIILYNNHVNEIYKPVETNELIPELENNGKIPEDDRQEPQEQSDKRLNITNLSIVENDFKNINDKAKISLNIKDNKLIVEIIQEANYNNIKANFVNITQYTDWALKNIKSDINILDITVKLPKSKIRAVLNMDKLINNDYFDENYVKKNIKEDVEK